MPPLDLATRKKALVSELNGFITAKKEFTTSAAQKAELTGANSPRAAKLGALKTQEGACCPSKAYVASLVLLVFCKGLHLGGCYTLASIAYGPLLCTHSNAAVHLFQYHTNLLDGP